MFPHELPPDSFSGRGEQASPFDAYLTTGEHLLWSGRPLRSIVFHRSDWLSIPFSLMWSGFSIFWERGVSGGLHPDQTIRNGGEYFMMLWGIPFILIGQYMVWGRFVYNAWNKANTFYALTDRRALVLTGRSSRKLLEGDLRNLSPITLSQRQDGIGSIDFGVRPTEYSSWRRYRTNPIDAQDLETLTFQDLPNVQAVHRQIVALREALQHKDRET